MKFNITLFALFLASICLSGFFFMQWRQSSEDNQRNQQNVSILAKEIKEVKVSQSLQTGILKMEISEVKKSFPQLANSLKSEFNANLRNVYQVTNTETVVNHTFKTTIKDSTRVDSISLKIVDYKDAWIDFRGMQTGNEFVVERNRIPVPLNQVIHREPWKPQFILPWKWGKRKLIQDVHTPNPWAVIEYSRTIDIVH